MYQTSTTWEMGDYDSPVVKSVQVSDKLGQTTTTAYVYDFDVSGSAGWLPWTNQVSAIKQLDYDGKTVLRVTSTTYQNAWIYFERHIFNLPATVTVEDGNGALVSRTDHSYDQYGLQPLVNTPGVTQHSNLSNPFALGYDPSTNFRGNITQITRHTSASPSSAGIVESLRYDITGNVIEVSGACCVDTAFTYTAATQFAYPQQVTRGAIDHSSLGCLAGSTACLAQSSTYDFGTGLTLTSTSADGLISQISYDDASRLLRMTLPQASSPPPTATAYVTYTYDDSAMTVTQSTWAGDTCLRCIAILQAQTVTHLNGLGFPESVQNSVGNVLGAVSQQVWDAVSQRYDARGRLWQVSQPYQIPQQPSLWTTYTYDSLGRTTAIQNPNGSEKTVFYSETNRPSSASNAPGQTVRSVDEVGRERWSRTDALGRLVEVVEPAANGNGSVLAAGNVETAYSYNALVLLTHVLQGPDQQERDFQYDLLGRLTAEYLAEKSRTLDANGDYVGVHCPDCLRWGQWSDIFTYDGHSNLISHVDARGVKTLYDFGDDPLNRLQSLSYETPTAPGTFDPSSPILPTPGATYGYTTTGDVTRLSGDLTPFFVQSTIRDS